MAVRKIPPERHKKASGANIEEWQRGTVRVRLPRQAHERAAEMASRLGWEVAEVIADLIQRMPMPLETASEERTREE